MEYPFGQFRSAVMQDVFLNTMSLLFLCPIICESVVDESFVCCKMYEKLLLDGLAVSAEDKDFSPPR